MPITTTTITKNEASGRSGQNRVVFHHVDDQGKVYGPYVEHRPTGEDHATFAANHATALTSSLAAAELDANMAEVTEGS